MLETVASSSVNVDIEPGVAQPQAAAAVMRPA
jgi:hypothetical protein